MNSSQLYKDELYAYIDEPPRGKTPLGAAKVRLRGQESRKSTWDTNRRTYAYITVVESGDTSGYGYGKHMYCKPGEELTVPARHLIDFWSDYEAETKLLREEQEERQRRKRRQALKEQVLTSMITWSLQNDKGIHMPVALLDLMADGSGFVKFQLREVLIWLGIDPETIEEKVDSIMEDE